MVEHSPQILASEEKATTTTTTTTNREIVIVLNVHFRLKEEGRAFPSAIGFLLLSRNLLFAMPGEAGLELEHASVVTRRKTERKQEKHWHLSIYQAVPISCKELWKGLWWSWCC